MHSSVVNIVGNKIQSPFKSVPKFTIDFVVMYSLSKLSIKVHPLLNLKRFETMVLDYNFWAT